MAKELTKSQILILCDVSGSVAAYAKFLLLFVLLARHLAENEGFAFSSNLGEVTETLRALPVETAIELVNLKYGGATDYQEPLRTSLIWLWRILTASPR